MRKLLLVCPLAAGFSCVSLEANEYIMAVQDARETYAQSHSPKPTHSPQHDSRTPSRPESYLKSILEPPTCCTPAEMKGMSTIGKTTGKAVGEVVFGVGGHLLGNVIANKAKIGGASLAGKTGELAISIGMEKLGEKAGSYLGEKFGEFIDRTIEANAVPRNSSHRWTGWYR